jgi:hypothetical protein
MQDTRVNITGLLQVTLIRNGYTPEGLRKFALRTPEGHYLCHSAPTIIVMPLVLQHEATDLLQTGTTAAKFLHQLDDSSKYSNEEVGEPEVKSGPKADLPESIRVEFEGVSHYYPGAYCKLIISSSSRSLIWMLRYSVIDQHIARY